MIEILGAPGNGRKKYTWCKVLGALEMHTK